MTACQQIILIKKRLLKNAAAYIEKLQALDKAYTEGLSQAKQKSFVTQHAAFNYLALDYGLKQVAISGLSPDAEPSAARLAELTEYIKKNKISYIYFEENASQALANTLSKEAGVKLDVPQSFRKSDRRGYQGWRKLYLCYGENLKALKTNNGPRRPSNRARKERKHKTVHNGYFEDADVKDRTLSDYVGNWQSVYPFLEDGTFDPSLWLQG